MHTSARILRKITMLLIAVVSCTLPPATRAQGLNPPQPKHTPGPPHLSEPTAVISVKPSVGVGAGGGSSVVIKANWSLAGGATSALFGSASVPLTQTSLLPDGTISASAPAGIPGSTVPVSVVFNGSVLPSTATFTYPIAEMDVEGPAPYDRNDIWCTEPFWRNGGGYSINAGEPGSLFFATLNPSFHITTAFQDISNNQAGPGPGPNTSVLLGNEGQFSGQLQMCNIVAAQGNAGDRCTNWDKNSGFWVQVGSSSKMTLASIGSGKTAYGDMILPVVGGLFDSMNLVRTLRYDIGLAQHDTHITSAACRQASQMSQPFNAVVSPAAMVQINTVPYTILYQPPGDMSTASFQASTTYGTQFSLGNSNEIDNTTSSEQNSSTTVSMSLAFFAGVNLNASDTWDQTTTQTFGTTHTITNSGSSSAAFSFQQTIPADNNLVPGSGTTCAEPTNCSTTVQVPNPYAIEPFWDDTFYLLVHPQFAVWVLGGQKDRYVMYGAVPVLVDVEVGQLDACANVSKPWYTAYPCQLQYSDDGLTEPMESPWFTTERYKP